MSLQHFYHDKNFKLESGNSLSKIQLGYTTLGALNSGKDNVVWIFHALTANSDPSEWWPKLVGNGKLFDPENNFIICVNMPGSCYGSSGPLTIDPQKNEPFYHDFPMFTTRDMIRSYQLLKNQLGIQKIKIGIGSSMGGQQLLEWAIEEPELFEYIFPIATNAEHSPWGRAFNASQRLCIETDPTWTSKDVHAGISGMKAARSVALLSYRHYFTYDQSQQEKELDKLSDFKSESYQRYQGEKLAKRFNAFSYYILSKSMDAHNVGRGRVSIKQALGKIYARCTVVGIESDLLFPISEQEFLAKNIPGATIKIIQSDYGHDGFLLEHLQIEKIIKGALVAF